MRTALMLGGIVAAVGGYYYLRRDKAPEPPEPRIAVEEIERWETRATKLRGCLLGDRPGSRLASEAMTIREIEGTPVELKACTASVKALSRGEKVSTGNKEVEAAWRTVGLAVSGLAQAFTNLLVPTSKPEHFEALGDALDQLDIAQSNLREAAGLLPIVEITRPLPKTELILFGIRKRAKLSGWLRPSAGGLVVLVDGAGERLQQLVLVPGEAPKRVPYRSGVRPSITDAWGAQAAVGELSHGTLTADGTLEDKVSAKTIEKAATPDVLFALGNAQAGAFAYVADPARAKPQLGVARPVLIAKPAPAPPEASIDVGTPIAADNYAFAVDPAGRGALAWALDDRVFGMMVRPGVGTKPVKLGEGYTGLMCLTATHAFMMNDDTELIAFDDTSALPFSLDRSKVEACDAKTALLRTEDDLYRYHACSVVIAPAVAPQPARSEIKCRDIELKTVPERESGLIDGKLISVAAHRNVLAIWREGEPPRYVALPQRMVPRIVHGTANVIDVVGETLDGLAIARVKL